MKRRLMLVGALALGWLLVAGDAAQAQPTRGLPGGRIQLPGSPPVNFPPKNDRTRPAASQVGEQSADFYAKNGYPKVLGDAVEQGNAASSGGGGTSGSVSGGGAAGNVNGGGFQGNIGNQIGSQSGGTIFGGIFGGGGGGFINAHGMTGGGFTGAVPKGFGFGGTPDLGRPVGPLHGVVNR